MKEISLSWGRVALIDDRDFPEVSKHKWYYLKPNGHAKGEYATGWIDGQSMTLHRFIMRPAKGRCVDHINGNGLDCRRSNMRLATTAQNQANRGPQANNTSGFKGVRSRGKRWIAEIKFRKKNRHIGSFTNPVAAARAYDAKARELFGEFAYQNFPSPAVSC